MNIEILPLIVIVLFGLVNCFYGYRLFQWLLVVWGLVMGASLGGELAAQGFDGNLVAVALAGLVGGVIGASIFAALYYLGVFLLGGLFLATVVDAVFQAFSVAMHPVFLLIPGVVGGLLALVLQKIVIVFATAFLGAFCLTGAGASWRFGVALDEIARDPSSALGEQFLPVTSVAFVLGVVGVLVQLLITSRGVAGKSA